MSHPDPSKTYDDETVETKLQAQAYVESKKSVDQGFECCKRFYYFGEHSFKCKQINQNELQNNADLSLTR